MDSNYDISARPAIINKEFLQKILSRDSSGHCVQINSYSIKRQEDAGFASDMYFIDVEYLQNEDAREFKNINLIMKCPPTGGEHQNFVCQSSAFLREITALSSVIPKMSSILDSKCPGIFEPFGPQIFYSHFNPEPMLIIENLKSYKMPCKHTGLDLSTCKKVLHILAQFHAASAVLYANEPQSMDVFRKPFFLEKPYAREHWTKVFTGLSRAFAIEVENWPEFGKDVSRKLHNFTDSLMDNLEQLLQPNDNGFNVLTHSDLWTNNMLFGYSDDNDSIDHIRFIDFQNSHFTSPIVDLHYFLTACPSYDIRLQYDDMLLEEYQNELSRVLNFLKYKGKCPSLSELKEEFDQKRAHSLFVAVTDLAMFLAESEFVFDSAIHKEGEPVKNKVFESKLYRRMMNKLLPFYMSKGVL